jgi:hypothetical protein
MRLGQAKLAAHDVGALDQRDAFVIGDAARQPLAAETAIGGDDEPLGRDVVECLSDQVRHVLGSYYQRQGLNRRSAGVVASGVNNCFYSTGLTGQANRERQLATH